MPTWSFSKLSSFLTQSKDVHVRLTGDQEVEYCKSGGYIIFKGKEARRSSHYKTFKTLQGNNKTIKTGQCTKRAPNNCTWIVFTAVMNLIRQLGLFQRLTTQTSPIYKKLRLISSTSYFALIALIQMIPEAAPIHISHINPIKE